MKKALLSLCLLLFSGALNFSARAADAPAAPAKKDPSIEERVADLEAYVNNGSRGSDAENAKITSKLDNTPGPGHNAWQMTSAALVLFMTLPGLALFYGGLDFAFLKGVTSAPNGDYSYWVSQNVYAMYQLMFAIITPALIIGAIAERMKFSAIMLFMTGWMFVVYFPQAHMTWGIDGLMNGVWNPKATIKAIDFAGSMVLCMIGTGMLWVGWYGFNAGSAVAADVIAANAFTTTTLATAVASFVWPMAEWITRGKPSVLGFCSGAVAGLVVITPACGFVTPKGAMAIGVAAGLVPWFFCYKVKGWFGYDDALDTFGVHAIGGTMGALMTGILADPAVNPNLAVSAADPKNPATQNGLAQIVANGPFHHLLWVEQLKSIGITLCLAVAGTAILAYIVKALIGLRPSEEIETAGLDVAEHGEEAYHSA